MNERDIVAEIEMAARLGYSLQITEAEARRVTALLAEREKLIAYINELELMVYENVRLSDVMRNVQSERTYIYIQDKYKLKK